jgi:hypothetical protein
MISHIRVITSNIQGAADTFYDMTDSSRIKIFENMFGASFSGAGISYDIERGIATVTISSERLTGFEKNNLVLYLDAGNTQSYTGTGSSWFDLSTTNTQATLVNSPTYSTSNNGYFHFEDTSSEYATIPNIGSLNNWTVIAWFRLTKSLTGKVGSIVTNQYDLSSRLNFSIGTNNAPINYNLSVGFFDGAWRSTTGFVPQLNTWYHIAGTYDGSVIRQYVNAGATGGTVTYSGTPQTGGQIRLMRRWDDTVTSSNLIDGDLSVVQIYNRALTEQEITTNYNILSSRYTPTFTNPTATVGSAVQVVAQSPFSGGGNSYQFFNANANSYIDFAASSDWAVGTGDYTIEWFQYTTTTSIPPYQRVFTVGDYPTITIGVSNEGGTFYYWANNSFRYSSSSAITTNVWQHWAIVRQSGTTRVYRDGTLRGSSFVDTNNINNTTTKLTIGAENNHGTNATFVGYITNFRWIKGLAVYTGNFTVPTSALTATAIANPYGGSNTAAIGEGFTKLLLVP